MTNAKEEFLAAWESVGKPQISCAKIIPAEHYRVTSVMDAMPSGSLILRQGYTKEEFDAFLDSLDFEYDSGYGLQELDGTVWCIVFNGECYIDSWFSRGEYDGSEWWKFNQEPAIPPECRLRDPFGWGAVDHVSNDEEAYQTWDDSPHLATYLPFLPEARKLFHEVQEYVDGLSDSRYSRGERLVVHGPENTWKMVFEEVHWDMIDGFPRVLEAPFVFVTVTNENPALRYEHELREVPSMRYIDVMHCAQIMKRLHDTMLGD